MSELETEQRVCGAPAHTPVVGPHEGSLRSQRPLLLPGL